MEALQASIAATCPSAFAGASGNLFVGAVAAVVAAHCTIFDGYQWPEDNAYDIIGSKEMLYYDFIIVGAGTAGSLLAGRLSSCNPSWNVLLIEAGDDPGVDSEIPSFLFLNKDSNIDWKYKTSPDGTGCFGFVNNSCVWNRGRGLGGSSSLNAMLYISGHPNDYENWKKSGNTGWGYEDLLPYFEKVEKELKVNNFKYEENPWYGLLDKAWQELGYISHKKESNEQRVGTRITKLLTRNGRRLNTAKVYLQKFKNLQIMKNTVVQRIIIDPQTKIASGVEIRHKSGIVTQISVSKEVILSAGAIATPQVLMLSGIGPKTHLNEKGIKCLADLHVGKNLQDHVFFPLLLTTNQNITLPHEAVVSILLQYMLTKTGPISGIGLTNYMGFINTNGGTDQSDIQYHHLYFPRNESLLMKSYYEGIGYIEPTIKSILEINKRNDILGIYPSLLYPKSKGEILLHDANPQSRSIIKANYFKNVEDIKTFTKAIKFVHVLEETSIFKLLELKIVQLNVPGCSQLTFDTEAYWECYIRHMGTTIYHPVGTAKMGPNTDKTAVVNEYLSVHGIKKLKVVDASVMPTIPGANTVATTLVIAEKAFDIIKKQYEERNEL